MQTKENETEILEHARNGNKSAFGKLVKIYNKRAFYTALSIVGSSEDAFDLSQEAFIKAYRSINKFDTTKKFFTWYYKILKNICLNHIRNKSLHAISFSEIIENVENMSDESINPNQQIEIYETRKAIWNAIWKLSNEDREIIVAREFLDTSYEDLSALMNVPIGTVMSRLYYARKRLKKILSNEIL